MSPPRHASSVWSDLSELLGSMRFAISLLVIICIASIAGTVLQQNRPLNTYIDQFGPFWAELFDTLSLFSVYNAWWFLLIMAFLVVSTTICVLRNAPSMMRDSLSFRDKVREGSWRSFPQRAEAHTSLSTDQAAERVARWLRKRGFSVKVRENEDSRLVAAKAGAGNRLGYIFAHVAIVVICVGGLFDSELPIRLQVMLGKVPVHENMRIADVPESGRLSLNNPSFRASALVPEGSQTRNAVVLVDDGALVQPLPFTLVLKDFVVDYYSTGMPSDFASHVTVVDNETGETFDTVIRVNEPLSYRGITVYQSSFDDGGSRVKVRGHAIDGMGVPPIELEGTVGETLQLPGAPGGISSINFTALRPINVENIVEPGASQPKALGEHVAAVTGSAARDLSARFQNVGPSIEYQLTDAAGQAVQYHNYMLPVQLDGSWVFLLGTRLSPAEPYRYLRLPVDANHSLDEFLLLRNGLANPADRQAAAERFANSQLGLTADPAVRQSVLETSRRALDVFAEGGLMGMSNFLEQNVPRDELSRAAEVVIRLLGSSLGSLRDHVREQSGMPPLSYQTADEQLQHEDWNRQALAALSDLTLYPAPVFFQLSEFDHHEASVFQLNRAPGQVAVYLGCLLLVLGVFAMFYVRERRLWVWLRPEGEGGSLALLAMTSQRRNLDFHREFQRLNTEFSRVLPSKEGQ